MSTNDRLPRLGWVLEADGERLQRCVSSAHPGLRRSAACNKALTAQQIATLAADDDFPVRLLLCENQAAVPTDLVVRTYLEARIITRGQLLSHPAIVGADLTRYADSPHWGARALVVLDGHAPAELIEHLSRDEHPGVRNWVAHDSRLSPQRLLELFENPETTEAAAANPNLPIGGPVIPAQRGGTVAPLPGTIAAVRHDMATPTPPRAIRTPLVIRPVASPWSSVYGSPSCARQGCSTDNDGAGRASASANDEAVGQARPGHTGIVTPEALQAVASWFTALSKSASELNTAFGSAAAAALALRAAICFAAAAALLSLVPAAVFSADAKSVRAFLSSDAAGSALLAEASLKALIQAAFHASPAAGTSAPSPTSRLAPAGTCSWSR